MIINKEVKENELIVKLEGRLDTTTSPELDKELKECFKDTQNLILDFENLEYISSAGLRILLSAHKKMIKKDGKFTVMNINETINEIFEVTGFSDILNIE